jgi:hypothetical protein
MKSQQSAGTAFDSNFTIKPAFGAAPIKAAISGNSSDIDDLRASDVTKGYLEAEEIAPPQNNPRRFSKVSKT